MPAAIGSADGLRGIFDNGQVSALGDFQNGSHFRRQPEKMHGEDGARARSDGSFESPRVQVVREGMNVDENRARTQTGDAAGSREECERRGDDFVTWSNALHHEC